MRSKYRWVLLLFASYYFYMCWNYKYIALIVFSTVVDYFAAILMHKSKTKKSKTVYLLASLFTNLGLLFVFKYLNFFTVNVNSLFDQFNIFSALPTFNLLLPVGISFYTFQTLSYTIDVYKGHREPEKHFGIFALYVSFFPQLVAGPIERSTHLLPQFHKKHTFDYEKIKAGLTLMVWGLFKKVVIADRLSEYVNLVYNNATDFNGIQNAMATFFFSFQIYCDFSGYSDIAIGASLVLGYNLMNNFRRPYLSRNIREFWQRWHISLSTWFRDYLYIPLGGNRTSKWRWHLNLYVTFLISGLWHGANWTFVIWGSLHGFYLVFAIWTKKIHDWTSNKFKSLGLKWLFSSYEIIITYILVVFAWIFFRANTLNDAFLIIGNIFPFEIGQLELNLFYFKSDFYIAIFVISFLMLYEIAQERFEIDLKIKKSPSIVKWFILILGIFSIALLGKWEEVDFLYFQF